VPPSDADEEILTAAQQRQTTASADRAHHLALVRSE